MASLYIFPNQLFNIDELTPLLSDVTTVVLWEHPSFFKKYKFNQKKLLLHRASMRYYFDNVLKRINNVKCTYIEFHERHTPTANRIFFDPINRIANFKKRSQMRESPNFLLHRSDYVTFMKQHDFFKHKRMIFTTHFYKFCKERLEYLRDTPSLDKENRNILPSNLTIPPLPNTSSSETEQYIQEATNYVNRHFKSNYGTTDEFSYPIRREDALDWLDDFFQNRLRNFGTYQDAIHTDQDYMFHSVLSSSINIGLIQPKEIVERLRNVENISMNNIEGFFRQLCWREYQRLCYIHFYKQLNKSNYYNLYKKLTKKWYTGDVGVRPVDICIKKAFSNAYLHHIERLMVMGNFMVLSGIIPSQAHKWFMEFAIDSYEWVMLQNVYDMVFFGGGGLTSNKPYISSSSYVVKMSNYKESEEWTTTWKAMYKAFILKHKDKLHKYRYHFPYI